MRTYLVTGGAGFIGANFVKYMLKKYEDIKIVESRIQSIKDKTLKLGEIEIKISLSLGISAYPKDGNNIEELITKADKKMYIQKRNEYE